MMFRVRGLPLLAAAALTACLACGRGVAQSLPPAPVPVSSPGGAPPGPSAAPGAAVPLAPPSTGLTPPPVLIAPPPSPYVPPPPDYHDPLPAHDALLEPSWAPSGWFGAAELEIVKPHFKNRLTGDVSFGDQGSDTVHVPGAALDWTAAPRFELGYRFDQGFGELLFSYRFLVSDGRNTIPNYDYLGDGNQRSRTSLNVFDIDYASHEFTPGPRWDMKWRLGVRLADFFYDAQAVGAFLEQQESNHFAGAGPHAGLDLWYHFDVPGLAAFARVEGALLIGEVRQRFEESFLFSDGSVLAAASRQSGTQSVPMVNVQLGLGWAPPGTHLRFSAGYEFEQWWDIGRTGDSRGELTDQGVFLRGEFAF